MQKLEEMKEFKASLNGRYGQVTPTVTMHSDGSGTVTLSFTPYAEVPIVKGHVYMARPSGHLMRMTGNTSIQKADGSLWVEMEDVEDGIVFNSAYTDIQAGWYVRVEPGTATSDTLVAATRERSETFMTHMLQQDIYG